MASTARKRSLFDTTIIRQAIVDAVRKLTPQRQVRNPVMFVVYVGSILTTLLWVQALVGTGEAPAPFIFWVSVWLWFTVLFANFAEAMAEGRGPPLSGRPAATSRRNVCGTLNAGTRGGRPSTTSSPPPGSARAMSWWS